MRKNAMMVHYTFIHVTANAILTPVMTGHRTSIYYHPLLSY